MDLHAKCVELLEFVYTVMDCLGLDSSVHTKDDIIPAIEKLKGDRANLQVALSKDPEGSANYEAMMIIKESARLMKEARENIDSF